MSRYIIECPDNAKIDIGKDKGKFAMGVLVGEIIRCGECRYWHKNRKEGDDIPVHDACYDFTDDDFCSYGEPKEELNGSERLVKGSGNPCETCANKGDHDGKCRNCVADSEPIRWKTPSHYEPKQTDCPWK